MPFNQANNGNIEYNSYTQDFEKEVDKMNLLFWNLAKNSNEKHIKNILTEHNIDIAVFAEYSKIDLLNLQEMTDNKYLNYNGYAGCDKITLFAKSSLDVTVCRENNRYTIYSVNCDEVIYNIAGIHLSANPYASPEMRKIEIRDLVRDICEQENKTKNSNTIVIGDFNASPFDSELTQKDTFNAVLFKELIFDKEYDTLGGNRYRRFYDPMLDYISEEGLSYGSYYYSGGATITHFHSKEHGMVISLSM